jgi:hypothetical protein
LAFKFNVLQMASSFIRSSTRMTFCTSWYDELQAGSNPCQHQVQVVCKQRQAIRQPHVLSEHCRRIAISDAYTSRTCIRGATGMSAHACTLRRSLGLDQTDTSLCPRDYTPWYASTRLLFS